jgi:hypothetical protein
MQAEDQRGTIASAQRASIVASVQGPSKKRKADTLFGTDSDVDSLILWMASDVGLQKPWNKSVLGLFGGFSGFSCAFSGLCDFFQWVQRI